VNQQTGETRRVERLAVDFIDWLDFLLNVLAVEVIDPAGKSAAHQTAGSCQRRICAGGRPSIAPDRDSGKLDAGCDR